MVEPTQEQIDIAKALASVDGFDPERMVAPVQAGAPFQLPSGRMVYLNPYNAVPIWRVYLDEARRMDEAVLAAGYKLVSIY